MLTGTASPLLLTPSAQSTHFSSAFVSAAEDDLQHVFRAAHDNVESPQ